MGAACHLNGLTKLGEVSLVAIGVGDHRGQVFYLAIALERQALPVIAAWLAADPIGRELMHERAAIDTRHVCVVTATSSPACESVRSRSMLTARLTRRSGSGRHKSPGAGYPH